jgi:predicted nucleotide-binding protein
MVTQRKNAQASRRKPAVFIASSSEDREIADAVSKVLMDHETEPTVWSQRPFRSMDSVLEDLIHQLERSDFGIFVMTANDTIIARGKRMFAPRDNVVLELGLFMGSLGRRHCFILSPEDSPGLKIPSDLAGLVTARFSTSRSDGNWAAAVGPACNEIAQAIREIGPRSQRGGLAPTPRTPSSALLVRKPYHGSFGDGVESS